MAFKDAKVGLLTSSGGRGGGGILTVYDATSTRAQIRANGYWTTDLSSDEGALRQRTAAEAFVRLQQDVDTGVVALTIGSDGADTPRTAKVAASGRIQFS